MKTAFFPWLAVLVMCSCGHDIVGPEEENDCDFRCDVTASKVPKALVLYQRAFSLRCTNPVEACSLFCVSTTEDFGIVTMADGELVHSEDKLELFESFQSHANEVCHQIVYLECFLVCTQGCRSVYVMDARHSFDPSFKGVFERVFTQKEVVEIFDGRISTITVYLCSRREV